MHKGKVRSTDDYNVPNVQWTWPVLHVRESTVAEVHAGPPRAASQVAETPSGCLGAGSQVAETPSGCLGAACSVHTELPAVLLKRLGPRGG